VFERKKIINFHIAPKMPETGGSETELSEKALQVLTRGWKIEQKLVEEKVQVDKEPLLSDSQRHDRNPSAEIVEDTECYKVLQPTYPVKGRTNATNDEDGQSEPKNYYYGGVDIGWPNPPKDCKEDPVAAAVYVVIDSRTMDVVYRDFEWLPMSEIPPYVSTFLSFREIDPLERLVNKQLTTRPELIPAAILVDGNGIFHPRHSGVACFLGVRTGIPTIGIGKTLLWIGSGSDNDKTKEFDDYQWTRQKLDERIDGVLSDLHRSICEDDSGLTQRLKEHKGLIIPKNAPPTTATTETESKEDLLKALAPYCNGIAIPLEAPRPKGVGIDERFEVLGTALIGHGGSKAACGSKRPIIVSVGHKLSQAEAASITASLSLFRIPEPVRAADLYGRDLLRERKML